MQKREVLTSSHSTLCCRLPVDFPIRLSHSTWRRCCGPKKSNGNLSYGSHSTSPHLLCQSLMLVLFRFLFLLCVIRFPAHQVDGTDETHELHSMRAGRGAWPSSGCIRPPTVQLSQDTSIFPGPARNIKSQQHSITTWCESPSAS